MTWNAHSSGDSVPEADSAGRPRIHRPILTTGLVQFKWGVMSGSSGRLTLLGMTARETVNRVAQQLREEFALLEPGARVPSEHALAERFHLGRGVIHGVLADFERRGLVRRERGAGTRWLGLDEQSHYSHPLPSFRDAVRVSGHEPGYRLIAVDSRRAVKSEQELLDLPANSLVWRVQRILSIDDVPVGFATSVLPLRALPRWPAEFESHGSIYETLLRRYGVASTRGWNRKRRIDAPDFVGTALSLDEPVPFRLAESLNVASDGRPVEYARSFMRADRFGLDALRAH